MEHDLLDIFEPENSEVEQALKALEAAAFPEENLPEATEPEQEEESIEEVNEENSEEAPEEISESEPDPDGTEEESGSIDPEPESNPEPEQELTEQAEDEEPCEETSDDAEDEKADEEPSEPKPPAVQSKAKPLAAKNRPGWFTIAVSAAAVILALMVIAMAILPDRRGGNTVSEESVRTSEEVAEEQSAAPTLYITRIDMPGAPEKEYVPSTDSEVVEKTPLFWGVDVSEHQQEIDWQTVSYTGADFAMIRAGYRGYTEGQIYADEYFEKNVSGAIKAGLDVGVYFFSQAVTVEEAVEEARFVLELVKEYKITYPIVYDWEFIENSSARTYSMSAKEVTDCAMAFCETVAYAGYTPMIYFGQNASVENFDLERLRVFDFWLADYTDTPVFPYDFQMWQYTSRGSIDGISGEVDVNYCFTEYKDTEASQ